MSEDLKKKPATKATKPVKNGEAAVSRAARTTKATKKTSRQARKAKLARRRGPKAGFSFRRNVMPAIAGLVVMLAVLGLLNAQWLVAQYRYHFPTTEERINTQVATSEAAYPKTKLSQSNTVAPHPELGPQLTIPSIGVNAPVEFNNGTAEWQIQLALRKGVVHYDNSAAPGQAGNIAIFGHSSGQVWAPGSYKFVFTLLNKVVKNDLIYLDYDGTRYTYKVTGSQVVAPTDVAILNSTAKEHELTLITCTPVGTSTNRLAVHAEQISPTPGAEPKQATPNKAKAAVPTVLPGNASSSIWTTIKSWF